MKILLIDNYESFTYNLVHYLEADAEVNVDVILNDKIDLAEIEIYDRIVISPGPGLPKDAGNILELIQKFSGLKPILGICLGHQAIGEAFGAQLENLSEVLHGVSTYADILVANECLFQGINSPILVGRYHSWVISEKNFPDCLEITSKGKKGEIMSIRHKQFNVVGVQFHPESILTPNGFEQIQNWLRN